MCTTTRKVFFFYFWLFFLKIIVVCDWKLFMGYEIRRKSAAHKRISIIEIWLLFFKPKALWDGGQIFKIHRKRKRYDKSPNTNSKFQQSKVTTQKYHQTIDYITIADRLRTVSWSNNSHPTGVVKPVSVIRTLPLTAKVVWTQIKKNVNNPSLKTENQQQGPEPGQYNALTYLKNISLWNSLNHPHETK